MIPLALAVLLTASAAPAASGPRVALLVANEEGNSDEAPLRFTGADAERLASVLRELGDFAPANVHILHERSGAEVLDALDALAKGPTASVFLFYYSGHADPGALHPSGTQLPLDLLLHHVRSVPAELHIAVLDACSSGAATRAKGSRPAAPFDVRIDDQLPQGEILLSSSAADEESFEGEHGGLFTLHLSAGLRGAADQNHDGQVTLGEAYAYAYAQTLRSTLAASSGPQHPAFRYELSGRHDPVLTRLSGAAALTLLAEEEGEYVVFDAREQEVIAEVPIRGSQWRRIALAPGAYLLKFRGPHALRVARIQVGERDEREVSQHQMQEVPLLRLLRKGSLGERWLAVSLGQYSSGLGPSGQFMGSLGVELERSRWLFGFDLSFSQGDEVHRELVTRDASVVGSLSALLSLRWGSASLRLGPVLGLGWLHEEPTGREAANGLGVVAGVRVRADLAVTQGLMFFALADGRVLGARISGEPLVSFARMGETGFLPWGAYQLGVRVAF